MTPLTSLALVELWEQGCYLGPIDQAIRVICAVDLSLSDRQVRSLPLAQRDRMLLDIRSRLFGDLCTCTDRCPHCAVVSEFEFSIHDLLEQTKDQEKAEILVHLEDYKVAIKAPTSLDVEQVLSSSKTDVTRTSALLSRCIVSVTRAGAAVSADQLPEALTEPLVQAMVEAQELADIRFGLTCGECGTGWSAPFDITRFLWDEIDYLARRLLHEVHRLASVYGWTDRDILLIPLRRRAFYLECIGT
ncbi:MAG: hypothetical protein GY703_12225 [Gammaproteobacteria bacterium]|nr:hypothetical protein [Gammaproteobacteria bacterium]